MGFISDSLSGKTSISDELNFLIDKQKQIKKPAQPDVDPVQFDKLISGYEDDKSAGEEYKKYTTKQTAQAIGSTITGLSSWVPAGLLMTGHEEPEQWLAGDTSVMSQGAKAEASGIIQEAFTYTPKDEGAQELAAGIARPLTWLAETGHESAETWYQWADEARKSGQGPSAVFCDTMGFIAGIGGEGAPFLPIPGMIAKGARMANKIASTKARAAAHEALRKKVEEIQDPKARGAAIGALYSEGVDFKRPKKTEPSRVASTGAPAEQKDVIPDTRAEMDKKMADDAKSPDQLTRELEKEKQEKKTEELTGEQGIRQAAWENDFRKNAELVLRAEKHGEMSEESARLLKAKPYDWRAFSESRGYSVKEMAEFEESLKLDKIGEKIGIDEADRIAIYAEVREKLDKERAAKERQLKKDMAAPKGKPKKIEPKKEKGTVDDSIRADDKKQLEAAKPTEVKIKPKGELKPSEFLPSDTLLTRPELANNTDYAFRSADAAEATELMTGKRVYDGSKKDSGNYLAGIPASASKYGGEGRFYFEFGNVDMVPGMGLMDGAKVGRDNVTRIYMYDKDIPGWRAISQDEMWAEITRLKNAGFVSKKTKVHPIKVDIGQKETHKNLLIEMEKNGTLNKNHVVRGTDLAWIRQGIRNGDKFVAHPDYEGHENISGTGAYIGSKDIPMYGDPLNHVIVIALRDDMLEKGKGAGEYYFNPDIHPDRNVYGFMGKLYDWKGIKEVAHTGKSSRIFEQFKKPKEQPAAAAAVMEIGGEQRKPGKKKAALSEEEQLAKDLGMTDEVEMPDVAAPGIKGELNLLSAKKINTETAAAISDAKLKLKPKEVEIAAEAKTLIDKGDIFGARRLMKKVDALKKFVDKTVIIPVGKLNDYLGQKGAIGDLGPSKKSRASSIVDLTESIKNRGIRGTLGETVSRMASNEAESIRSTFRGATDFLGRRTEDFKSGYEQIRDTIKHPSRFTNFQDMLGKYQGAIQRGSFEAREFARAVKKAVPNELDQVAMTNYIEAGGDIAEVRNRLEKIKNNDKTMKDNIANLAKKSQESKAGAEAHHFAIRRYNDFKKNKDSLIKGYERTLEMNDHVKGIAEDIRKYYEAKFDEAHEMGFLEHGYNNYINHAWAKPARHTRGIFDDINYGVMRKNPDFVRRRIHSSYFDGEMLGLTPKTKSAAFLITAYDSAFTEAVAARGFIKSLENGRASDGRPYVLPEGGGRRVERTEGDAKKVNHYVYPDMKKDVKIKDEAGNIIGEYSTDDYTPVNHPAMRKWKWIETIGKEPVMMEGRYLAHPDIMGIGDNLAAVLEKSRFSEVLVHNVLETSAYLKGTLLSMSAFHQVQIGLHGLFHGVIKDIMPGMQTKLDFRDPHVKLATETGTILADYKGMQSFHEGVAGAGLTYNIPFFGKFFRKYSEYLFHDYIPRVKMAMWKDAFERNTDRYGKLMDVKDIASITSDQANAAFGELNYAKMGRHKTTQDMLRFFFLAPDFLEARARFVGQALRTYGSGPTGIFNPLKPFKGGNEQFVAAAVRGAAGMFIGARILNYLTNDGDYKWDKPFSWVIGGKEYTLRSVPGDLYHLMSDWRSFLYNRTNPFVVRQSLEFLTSRDEQGRYRTPDEQLVDLMTSFTPIVMQKKGAPPSGKEGFWGAAYDWIIPTWEGLARSAGVNIFDAKTAFQKEVHTMASHALLYTPDVDRAQTYKVMFQIADLKRHAILEMDDSKYEHANKLEDKFLNSGVLGEEDLKTINDMATRDHIAHRLNFLSAEQMFQCMKSADYEETLDYTPQFEKKLAGRQKHHPDRYNRLMDRIIERDGADIFEKIKIWLRERYEYSALGIALGHNIPAYQKYEDMSGEGEPEAPEPQEAVNQ